MSKNIIAKIACVICIAACLCTIVAGCSSASTSEDKQSQNENTEQIASHTTSPTLNGSMYLWEHGTVSSEDNLLSIELEQDAESKWSFSQDGHSLNLVSESSESLSGGNTSVYMLDMEAVEAGTSEIFFLRANDNNEYVYKITVKSNKDNNIISITGEDADGVPLF